ncbi:MAG: flavodoxin family protein, partial [Clostridia bacterium]|nr:flavodoxin family protein [Clostridia bacterium]
GGQEETIRAMQTLALVQGMTVINSGHWDFDAGHMGVSAQRPASEDEFAISRCHSMAKRIIDEIQK